MRFAYAYAFESPLSLDGLRERFEQLSQWRWLDRDNDRWGEYISARAVPDPHHAMVKVIWDEGRYVINVFARSDAAGAQAAFDALEATILDQLLPGVDASNVHDTELYE